MTDLATAIAEKRKEIEASGLCQWGYWDYTSMIAGPFFPFKGRLVIWVNTVWPFFHWRKGERVK